MAHRSPLTRAVVLAMVAVGGASGVTAAAIADDGPAPSSSAPAALGAGDALRVAAGPDGTKVLRTLDGRTVRLRGANVNALIDYGGAHPTVPVTPQDGVQARALGFTVMRLAVSWSRIAPAPGEYDTAYLDEIRSAARAFTDQGVRVLLDLHQDRYAAGLGPSGDESDGAPGWAVVTDGASTAKDSGGHGYYGTAASRAAANAFFTNRSVEGKGLQEHYADAIAQLAAVGEDLGPGLAGVELYNEPVDPVGTDPWATDTFSPDRLWPLYRRLITRLRGPDGTGPGQGAYDGPVWFEPHTTRTNTDDDRAAATFSDDPNLVYGPHIYTDVYNNQLGEGTYARLQKSFDNAAREARAYGAALAPTELPGAQTGPWELHRGEVLRHLDRLDAGGMVWVWKQAAGPSDYGWGVLRADGSVRPESGIARDYGRARLQASDAPVASSVWADGVLTIRTTGAGTLDLWDGATFASASPAAGAASVVTVDGAAPATGTLTGRRAAGTLQSSSAWVGGRELRLSVPAGDHVVVLRPAAAGETPTPAPAAVGEVTPPTTGETGPTVPPTTTDEVPPTTTTEETPPTTTDEVPPTTTQITTPTEPPTTTGEEEPSEPPTTTQVTTPTVPPTTTQVTTPTVPPTTTQVTTPSVPPTTTSTTPAPSGDPLGSLVGAIGGIGSGILNPVGSALGTLGALLSPATTSKPSASAVKAPAVAPVAVATPTVSRAAASPQRFRPLVGGRGGTRVVATVSKASRLKVVLERRVTGRRNGARCVAATGRSAKKATSCTRWTSVSTQTHRAAAGRTVVKLTGWVAGRVLPAGAYRAVITPTAAGKTGEPRRVSMTVLKPAR